ncbi:efflux RND transporter periplasmic adaptor subunit [Teredinibacter sp. KSP-S5-2]|uniref:efflux RND transporter periplasmic adaptor subunit n=1 Tax=Teredinibacter sp. KSP-S5-2 TaxID=3034506 RepID=UPI0029349347|nr:efflux RND transporter periplasmic adaptor subunit [Teredinibacter sp. KSP-S5-2]WNO11158.1 efflux RND transporter periplasmic adaptor subunit [Teredinibacter sp. KSP-S5-2]
MTNKNGWIRSACVTWMLLVLHSNSTAAEVEVEKVRRFEVYTETQTRAQYQQTISSYAELLPHQVSLINPLVTALIVRLAPEFEAGAQVKKGQVLVELDKTEFEYQLAQAKQAVAQAKLNLIEEQTLSQRAIDEWNSQHTSKPSPYVARLPQVDVAKAELSAAKYLVLQAQHNLDATSITAPFDGWIIHRFASVGNMVNPSVSLAEIIPSDKVIAQIPLTPEQVNDVMRHHVPDQVSVVLYSLDSSNPMTVSFTGLKIGSIQDKDTRQVMSEGIIHLTENILGKIRPGNFLRAEIQLDQRGNYFSLPKDSVNNKGKVFVLDDSRVKELSFELVFTQNETLIVDIPNQDKIELISSGIDRIWDGMPAQPRVTYHDQ